MKKLRGIELSAYIESTANQADGAALFIVNNMPDKGRILFSCSGETGATQTVVVHDTWVPLDLTTQAQREKLIRSTQFKDLLRKSAIRIVAAEVPDNYKERGFVGAEEFLQDPDAREEYQNVLAKIGSVVTAVATNVDDEAIDMGQARTGRSNPGHAEREASDIAISLIAREEAGEDESVLTNAFRTKTSSFTNADLKYIMAKSKIAKIKETAASILSDATDDIEAV